MFDTLLLNGNIVFPGREITTGDIAIKDGKIAAVSAGPLLAQARHVIDARG